MHPSITAWPPNLFSVWGLTVAIHWPAVCETPWRATIATILGIFLLTGCDGSGTATWNKFHANNANNGLAPVSNAQGQLKWAFKTGGYVRSSPSLGKDGTIYVGSDDSYVYAVNPSGMEKWQFQTNAWVESSPAVVGGIVYIGDNSGRVYALDADNGNLKWSHQTPGVFVSSPAVSQQYVYVGSTPFYGGGSLYALDPADGNEKWSFPTNSRVSSPAVSPDGTVYIGSLDHKLYAIDGATGKELWEYIAGGSINASPAIGVDGTVYVGSEDGLFHAIIGATGKEKWSHQWPPPTLPGLFTTAAVIYEGGQIEKIFVADGNGLWAFDTSGGLLWGLNRSDIGWVNSSPAVVRKGLIYSTAETKLCAFDSETGKFNWCYTRPMMGYSQDPAVGPDGTVYFGNDDWNLYALK